MKSVFLLLGAVVFSYLLNNILLKFSHNFGIDSRSSQNLIRWSTTKKPTTGGISFFITFLLGFIILLIQNPETTAASDTNLALLVTATLAFIIGFADDAYGTHPLSKFLGQVMCGVILIFFGISIQFFQTWNPNLYVLDYCLTIFWVVGLMNSLNMLDNMDGVTTTIALSILLVSAAMMVMTEGISNMFYILIAVAGSFIGFLFLNWKPSKIYMGDTGSMFIGLLMAFVGIKYFWNIPEGTDSLSIVRSSLIPLLVFIVPIMDTSMVTFARLARGSSPFVGGRDHLTHNLTRVGIAEQWVPVTLGIVSIISGTLAIFIYRQVPEWDPVYSLLFSFYPIIVCSLFTTLYLQGTRNGKIRAMLEEQEKTALSNLTENQPLELKVKS